MKALMIQLKIIGIANHNATVVKKMDSQQCSGMISYVHPQLSLGMNVCCTFQVAIRGAHTFGVSSVRSVNWAKTFQFCSQSGRNVSCILPSLPVLKKSTWDNSLLLGLLLGLHRRRNKRSRIITISTAPAITTPTTAPTPNTRLDFSASAETIVVK